MKRWWSGVCLWLPLSLAAQTVTVKVDVDRDSIGIGERIVYSITTEHPKNITLLGEAITDLTQFEIVQVQKHQPADQGALISEKTEYTITTFSVDTFIIRAPKIAFLLGGDTLSAEGQPKLVFVTSVLDTAIKDIRPEKPLIAGKINWTMLVLIGVGLLLILTLIVYGAYRLYKRYQTKKNQHGQYISPVPLRSPEEIAIENLDAVRQKQWIERGEFKIFHIEVSNIIRLYIEQKFQMPALELPTSELITEFRRRRLRDDNYSALLRRFLEVCDLVKFAKYQASQHECKEVFDQAYDLVRINMANLDTPLNVVEKN
ncbi:hypothetical protein K1X84_03460 [bacterium]|nr:hypothetical protein [bacterium]